MFWPILWSLAGHSKNIKFESQLQTVFNGQIELSVRISEIYKIQTLKTIKY